MITIFGIPGPLLFGQLLLGLINGAFYAMLSLGLAVIPVFLLVGNLRLTSVVRYQIEHGWFIAPFVGDWINPWKWLLAIPMIITFLVFMIAIFAETNRLPFDLPEAEQELAGGYNTEYSSMKFALYFLGEYAAMITGSAVVVTLFFGGWHFPWIADQDSGWLIKLIVFAGKVTFFIVFFMVVRWTLPRFRFDQLMALAWKVLIPLALANLVCVMVVKQLDWSAWLLLPVSLLVGAAGAWLSAQPGSSDGHVRMTPHGQSSHVVAN